MGEWSSRERAGGLCGPIFGLSFSAFLHFFANERAVPGKSMPTWKDVRVNEVGKVLCKKYWSQIVHMFKTKSSLPEISKCANTGIGSGDLCRERQECFYFLLSCKSVC